MQHAGLQYGQGAATSHQSPPFIHADISQSNGGNTTSSLRQFRKKDGTEKNSSTDLNTNIENSHIARVPPHNHYPARPNDYFRYQNQFPDYNSPFKEPPAQVKYSEIAETPQPLQNVDHISSSLQKHKEVVHKEFMDMCNISQQTQMKQSYPDNLTRQQSYPSDAASVHHQYLHKEPQVHPGYKPESQYQQYPQLSKYNMPSQCRKYPLPPPPENDFLAKLQRINPSMARSIMSDHHIRETQNNYPTMEQNRMYAQNQRYYPPTHMQNNLPYNYQYNYPSSCNYKHSEYQRSNQMAVGGAQYPTLNPHSVDRSISPRNLHMMNYGTSPQKISPNYPQYNAPEYAQHYQHRRTSLPQDYYQQTCRTNPYMSNHQISPESSENRSSSGGLRHFIENWAEEETSAEIAPIFKENIRIHNNETSNEQVFVINSADIPQCLENVSLVPTENGQYIIKTGASAERTVNVQIVETASKTDCMLAEETEKVTEETTVPYQNIKDCDETLNQIVEEQSNSTEKKEENSVIVTNEVSVIKDMPLIDDEHNKTEELKEDKATKSQLDETIKDKQEENQEEKDLVADEHIISTTKRTQRIFSVDDIINKIGSSPTQTRRNSLQFIPKGTDEESNEESITKDKEENEGASDGMEYRNAISVEDNSVIIEIGGAWVQLNINHHNGTKVLSVLPLSESLVIDVNGNYQVGDNETISSELSETTHEKLEEGKPEMNNDHEEVCDKTVLTEEVCEETVPAEEIEPPEEIYEEVVPTEEVISTEEVCEESVPNKKLCEETVSNKEISEGVVQTTQHIEEVSVDMCQSEIIIGEDSVDSEMILDLSDEATVKEISEETEEEVEISKTIEMEQKQEEKRKLKDSEEKTKLSSKKLKVDERKETEDQSKTKKSNQSECEAKTTKKNKNEKNETKKNTDEFKKKDVKKHDRNVTDDHSCKKHQEVKVMDKNNKSTENQVNKIDDQDVVVKITNNDEKKPKITEIKKSPLKEAENNMKASKRRKLSSQSSIDESHSKKEETVTVGPDDNQMKNVINSNTKTEENSLPSSPDVIQAVEEMITLKQLEESKEIEKPPTKAAKKLYINDYKPKEVKVTTDERKKYKKHTKIEETVNKIKSLKEKTSKNDFVKTVEKKSPKSSKKVTFSLETELREVNKEEDKKKLSWEEYNSRKRKPLLNESEEAKNKIMENTVTSTDDINEEVVKVSKENVDKDSSKKRTPPKAPTNWEDDTPSPESPVKNEEVMSTTNRKCIIDVNEFNIKPMQNTSTPSPVSSSQFSYHSEDDSLQVYKNVVDSKLNSLNITIPKLSKPKPIDRFSVLFDRFLNKGSLNCEELEEVKKFIEIKRKMLEEEDFKKVPKKRKKKRFRNLYAETSSDDSDSSRSEKGVGDYSVYQRDSQGVPKLIIKRNSGLPQPFVKLERSQAVELLAKKRKLY